jgi:hypothetical protein
MDNRNQTWIVFVFESEMVAIASNEDPAILFKDALNLFARWHASPRN